MESENRNVVFDPQLKIEAYHFQGVRQSFPAHFHDYYVIGYIERGKRQMTCKGEHYVINAGDLILFNQGDNHSCEQVEDMAFDYRALNIEPDVMKNMVEQITGEPVPPRFRHPVIRQCEHTGPLKELHKLIMEGQLDFEKEETFFFLVKQLLDEQADKDPQVKHNGEDTRIQDICTYLEGHYGERISLDDLSEFSGMNKYHLLRTFTRAKGITPYRYLETVRIGKAKKLLELGTEPLDAAMRSGFSDQSHFTNFFKEYIGLTPKQYQNIFKDETR